MRMRAPLCLVVAAIVPALAADEIAWWPEYLRPDPLARIVPPDRSGQPVRPKLASITAARGGYASAQAVVLVDSPRPYHVEFQLADKSGNLQLDVFREWFHYTEADKNFYPDALIPIQHPYDSRLPEEDNRIGGQLSQAFWVDVWIPAGTPPGDYTLRASLRTGQRGSRSATLRLRVLDLVVPPEDPVTIDHNSYGSSFLEQQYPRLAEKYQSGFYTSDDFFRLIHAHHRIFYEHRGTFHQLGYGHGGKVGPEFAPALTGHGRNRKVASWDLYDRHYGPLLDGSAFAKTRRGARAVPSVYLPINPEWPASFLHWGEPAYETEFVKVVGEMEDHFRKNNWVNSKFEIFFNHKKRYKAFPWDGDETRFLEDFSYFREYGRLVKKAIPPDSPVKFLFRADVSWAMPRQFDELKGIVDMWIAAASVLSWHREAPKMLQDRGDILWHYGSPPTVLQPAVTITRHAMRTWMWRAQGFVHWLTVSPGEEPWYKFDGGATALVYPGDRFGLFEPLPSVRLKIQRNALQDLALAQALRIQRAELSTLYNGTQPGEWWNDPPDRADRPPREWSNPDLDEASRPADKRLAQIDPDAWQRVRDFLHTRK